MFKQGPTNPVCRHCNKPLQISRLDNGDYALGHMNIMECGTPPKKSIAITGTASEVLDEFMSNPVTVERAA